PGGQPARADRLGDRLDLLVTDRRRLEGEKRLTPRPGELLHGRSVLASPTGQTQGTRYTSASASAVTNRIFAAARSARTIASFRESPTASTAPARSAPRRKGPNSCPGWR